MTHLIKSGGLKVKKKQGPTKFPLVFNALKPSFKAFTYHL